jgi:hypothetical protein
MFPQGRHPAIYIGKEGCVKKLMPLPLLLPLLPNSEKAREAKKKQGKQGKTKKTL